MVILYVLSKGDIMAARHFNDILEPIGRTLAGAIGDAFILMQDNARAHKDQVSMTFIDVTGISVMNWPADHASDNLSRRIRQRPHHPQNVQNITDALVQELQAIPLNCIRSMTRRCQECVNDMGVRQVIGEIMC